MLKSTCKVEWILEELLEGQLEEDSGLLRTLEVEIASPPAQQFRITNLQQWIDLNA
jgi:hypothetical protein